MAKRPNRTPNLDLVVIEGADDGMRLQLTGKGPFIIGRAAGGLSLTDQMVSIYHCELAWSEMSLTVKDTDSATGTEVNGKRLGRSEVRLLALDDVIKVGDTRVQLVKRQTMALYLALALGMVIVSGAMAAGLALLTSGGPKGLPPLTWREPIRQGVVRSPDLQVATSFVRQRGFDSSRWRIRRVTDFDTNGIDEVWLVSDARELAITFDGEGNWVQLADLPLGCVDGDRATQTLAEGGFPTLSCPGRFLQLLDGEYRVIQQEGAVVWVRPKPVAAAPPVEGAEPAPRAEPGPTGVYRVGLRRPEALSGFLASRGIQDPVVWVVCEDAWSGVAAQVRTASGRIVPLGGGCLADIRLDGRVEGDVVAIAFTAAGHEALLQDLRKYLAGNEDGMFLTDVDRAEVERWSADPGFLQGGARLEFVGNDAFFQPVPTEGILVPTPDLMVSTALGKASSPAVTATLLTPGKARLDPPGCADLEIHTDSWSCVLADGCVSASTFLTVTEKGCGEPRQILSVPYNSGITDVRLDDLDVRVATQSGGSDGAQVTRARVSYRQRR